MMENNSLLISKELQEQIEQEAQRHAYCVGKRYGTAYDNAMQDFEAGATAYAARWEQAKKALEEIANNTGWQNFQAHKIAQEALASWKEEGKEGGV